jgi:hypothetical protein
MQNNEEEELKTKFIRQTYQLIYEYKFEELLNLIKENYPSFANNNQNIIYILMKFNFIKIILYQHDISSAKDYYSNHLLIMMKKIYGEKSISFFKKNFKYINFLNLINTSFSKYIYLQNHFKLENHLDKFMNLIEKKIEKRQKLERKAIIFNIIKSKANSNKDTNESNFTNTNNGKPLFKTEHVNMLIYNSENMSEIEDELFKLNLEERKKNIFTLNKNFINNDNIITGNEIEYNINDNINNSEEFNISDISNSNTSSYNELNNKKINIKKFEEKREIQSINNSKQKFNLNNKIRRVNLCKKIVRKFKKYLKKNMKEITTYSFWTSFCRENYLPPFKKEEVEFKSFSHTYLNWLFSHQGGIELYSQFIRNSGEEELNKIYADYNFKDTDDKLTIKNFFINFAVFFANLKINEISNNSDSVNSIENINTSSLNKGLFFEPDFATNNLLGNFNYNIRDEDEELSIGSIKDFCNEERINNENDKNKEFIREYNDNIDNNIDNENKNKMIVSSDSNSSLDNIDRNCNLNLYKNQSMKYNIYNINSSFNAANFHSEEFFINNIDKKQANKLNEIYPDINTFEFDYENKIKVSPYESIYFFNKEGNGIEEDNKYEKKED